MTKSNHKYRATIYLGKDIYTELEKLSNTLGIGLTSLAGIIFKTGWEMSKMIDKQSQDAVDVVTEAIYNGK